MKPETRARAAGVAVGVCVAILVALLALTFVLVFQIRQVQQRDASLVRQSAALEAAVRHEEQDLVKEDSLQANVLNHAGPAFLQIQQELADLEALCSATPGCHLPG